MITQAGPGAQERRNIHSVSNLVFAALAEHSVAATQVYLYATKPSVSTSEAYYLVFEAENEVEL